MRIVKALTTLLASAALTSPVWGAAIDPETNINVVRAPPGPPPPPPPPPPPSPPSPPAPADPDPALPGPAIDEKIRQYCGGYLAKRDDSAPYLHARATQPSLSNAVKPGEYGSHDILGLWTEYLVTCTGIAIVGTPKEPRGNTRFMYHTITVQQLFDQEWNKFANDVRKAELQDARAVISIMHPEERHPVKHGDITEDMTSSMNKVIDNIKSSIKDLIGDDPQVEYHYGLDTENGEGDAGTMHIDMSNNIFVSGRQV